MLWLFERILAEPARVEREMAEERQSREPRDEADGDPPDLTCRACAYRGPERFCPRCLADTMSRSRSGR